MCAAEDNNTPTRRLAIVRRSFVILAIGGGLVAAGFMLLEVNTYSKGQGAQEQSFPIAILTLNPNEKKATQWRITDFVSGLPVFEQY